jgi:hypothetical protein
MGISILKRIDAKTIPTTKGIDSKTLSVIDFMYWFINIKKLAIPVANKKEKI